MGGLPRWMWTMVAQSMVAWAPQHQGAHRGGGGGLLGVGMLVGEEAATAWAPWRRVVGDEDTGEDGIEEQDGDGKETAVASGMAGRRRRGGGLRASRRELRCQDLGKIEG